ncbi:hypothetical protein P10159_2746 [Citrobacter portucalensis]|nr:hypothetical protein P10159_2746 [Citrobacter portucalensis]
MAASLTSVTYYSKLLGLAALPSSYNVNYFGEILILLLVY